MLTKYIKRKEKENIKYIEEERSIEEKRENIYVGAHLSIVGGIEVVFERMKEINGRALGMFLKNQRTFASKPYEEETCLGFIKKSEETREYILPHASYLINLAQPDAEKGERAYKGFLDEMKRCDQLRIPLLNFHPGSNVGGLSTEKACLLIAERINRAHKETEHVVAVIENMAGQGRVLGSTFKEISTIIEGVENKDRVGVCLDTAHLFGAGYDIRTKSSFSKVMQEFDETVGLKYLRAMHLNDSKVPLNSKRDRHESIGKGLIGLEAFEYIVNSKIFTNIPLILETPNPSEWKKEIELLYSLIK
ncbi:AP endonuclease 1 [Nematocida sp. LUAm3]|nr:AP endonuclease 1 [Nematocida sp. LUAm3]KAI5175653.1 AP endonuclease 1 [Nematocida sp. LUAm2]KAI5178559.1 AP endonuclease 1 [Nematocida sp. LUAm1]